MRAGEIAMEKRDLKADLELFNKAIPCLQNVFAEWDGKMVLGFGVPGEHIHQLSENEYSLITQACEGWPHTLERAIEAEALNRVLVEALGIAIGWASHSQVTSLGGTKVSFRETSRSRIVEKVLAKAKEVIGDEN